MKYRKRKVVVGIFLFLCIFTLVACINVDGVNYMHLEYTTGTGSKYIAIRDKSPSNGIYVNATNLRFNCPEGPNERIQLPASTQQGDKGGTATAFYVETICYLGQEKFDDILNNFHFVQGTTGE